MLPESMFSFGCQEHKVSMENKIVFRMKLPIIKLQHKENLFCEPTKILKENEQCLTTSEKCDKHHKDMYYQSS